MIKDELSRNLINGTECIWRKMSDTISEVADKYVFEAIEESSNGLLNKRKIYGMVDITDSDKRIGTVSLFTLGDVETIVKVPLSKAISMVEEHAVLITLQKEDVKEEARRNYNAFVNALKEKEGK